MHNLIRSDIISGRWMPGARLQPMKLSEVYRTSTTVIRESLTRLAGEGFVSLEQNHGFSVPRLSLDELRDLTEVRCRMEGLAVELAIQRGDLAWESELIAAHHQLSRTARRPEADPEHVSQEWEDAHRAFHVKLIEASNVPVLLKVAENLTHSTELYRRWAAPSSAASSRDVEQEHRSILDAALKRDAVAASAALRSHYEKTVDVILKSRLVDGVEAGGTP